jgi:hypothetical protein
MTAFCMVIRRVYLHDVFMIVIGVEGAHQEEEEPSHHNVAPEMSLPYEPSQTYDLSNLSSGFLRGLLWTEDYFPENWFKREHDEMERHFELQSTLKNRVSNIRLRIA